MYMLYTGIKSIGSWNVVHLSLKLGQSLSIIEPNFKKKYSSAQLHMSVPEEEILE